jgi:hypothetical protein
LPTHPTEPLRAPTKCVAVPEQLARDAQFAGYALWMSDEVHLSISLPLDGDGFLRRECPTCEREFKWLPSLDADADEDAVAETAEAADALESYYCPYCAVTAPPDAWLTKAQVTAAEEIVQRELIDPELHHLEREIDRLNRSSGGLIGIEVRLERDEPEPARELDESDDMRRVDFTCHPPEPVKVLDDWEGPVHCLICGEPAVT